MGLLKRIEFWWEERKIHKAYADRNEEHEDQNYVGELWELDQKRRHYSDRKLITKARRHYVPIPESAEEGFWAEEDEDNWFLTDKGVSHLRREIRAEKKVTRDMWLSWVPLISALAILIGAISGLIAYLAK